MGGPVNFYTLPLVFGFGDKILQPTYTEDRVLKMNTGHLMHFLSHTPYPLSTLVGGEAILLGCFTLGDGRLYRLH